MEIYQPAEDSLMFAAFLKNYLSGLKKKGKEKMTYCDMGTGSGILAESVFSSGVPKQNILSVDVNPDAARFVLNRGFNAVESDLFSKMEKENKFDLISFNAPYLPEDKFDKGIDTTGGKKGDEVSLRFLKEAKKHINKDGKIFLLISSLTPLDKINRFNPKEVARKKLPFFEELIILEFRLDPVEKF